MPEEAQQEGGGHGARCWPQWITFAHSRSPSSEAPTRLPSDSPAGFLPAPPRATAASKAGCVLYKEARGSPRSSPQHTPSPPRAAFPKGRKDFSLPKVSVYLPSHIPAGLHLPQVGLLFLFPTKVAGTTSIPRRLCFIGWGSLY